jgi:fluoride ion exporter CrcB/FEX
MGSRSKAAPTCSPTACLSSSKSAGSPGAVPVSTRSTTSLSIPLTSTEPTGASNVAGSRATSKLSGCRESGPMNRPVTLTTATTRSAVKFSVATRGSVEVGSTLDNVNVEVAGGPDIPRCVIPGVAGNFNKVSTMSVVTFSLLSSNRSQHRICRAGLACAMAIAVTISALLFKEIRRWHARPRSADLAQIGA